MPPHDVVTAYADLIEIVGTKILDISLEYLKGRTKLDVGLEVFMSKCIE